MNNGNTPKPITKHKSQPSVLPTVYLYLHVTTLSIMSIISNLSYHLRSILHHILMLLSLQTNRKYHKKQKTAKSNKYIHKNIKINKHLQLRDLKIQILPNSKPSDRTLPYITDHTSLKGGTLKLTSTPNPIINTLKLDRTAIVLPIQYRSLLAYNDHPDSHLIIQWFLKTNNQQQQQRRHHHFRKYNNSLRNPSIHALFSNHNNPSKIQTQWRNNFAYLMYQQTPIKHPYPTTETILVKRYQVLYTHTRIYGPSTPSTSPSLYMHSAYLPYNVRVMCYPTLNPSYIIVRRVRTLIIIFIIDPRMKSPITESDTQRSFKENTLTSEVTESSKSVDTSCRKHTHSRERHSSKLHQHITIQQLSSSLPHLIYNTYSRQRIGGGMKNLDNTDDDAVTISSTESLTTSTETQWIPFPNNRNIQKQTLMLQTLDNSAWSPQHSLQFQTQQHPLLQTIQYDEIAHLRTVCQQAQNMSIIRCAHDNSLFITRNDIQSLLTHGRPTNDHVMLLYIKIVSDTYKIPFLYTDFIPRLINEGWINVERYFSDPSRHTRRRTLNRPNMGGEPAIIIPAHINESHWLALVRREYNNKVLFLYADDMNSPTTERDIKHVIKHQTNEIFCPSDAQWIKCKNTYFTPHSNECGPRTLLALHIMATHPAPDKNILTHLMHPNLAQISRVWIATSLISGKFHDTNILSLSKTNDKMPFSYTGTSTPKDVIDWSTSLPHQNDNAYHTYESNPHSKSPSSQIDTNKIQTSDETKQSKHNDTQMFTEQDPTTHNTDHSLTQPSTINMLHCPTVIMTDEHISLSSSPQSSQAQSTSVTTPDNNLSPKHLPQTKQENINSWTFNRFAHLHQDEASFLTPFGHDLQQIDDTATLRIIMQNTQFALHLSKTNHEISQIIKNITTIQASVFAAISPNVNFCNASNLLRFRSPFKQSFKQIHIAASSSEMGNMAVHRNRETLIGGTAILTFDHWASKVHSTQYDTRGHGTFSVTTYKGKNGRYLSLIAAYIVVQKGTMIGETSLYAQQTTLMELDAKKNKTSPRTNFCPRKDSIKELSELITSLQEKDHSIILMVDANQASHECITSKGVKKYSIEWLRLEHGMDDPFTYHFGKRPPTTTINNGRDIDFIYTWGLQTEHVSTLAVNTPANSDHLGICIDINIESIFECRYDKLSSNPRRKLTLKNVKAKIRYISYITEQWKEQNYFQRAQLLYAAMVDGTFNFTHYVALQELDKQITKTLLTGENQCAKDDKNRNPWSPKLCEAGLTLSYWKKKFKMSQNKCFRWHILESLFTRTTISLPDHETTNPDTIRHNLRQARRNWKTIKRQADEIRQQFLKEQAEEHARKRNITSEKALKAIQQAEQSKQTYLQINELIGGKKTKTPLTQIEVTDPEDPHGAKITLTQKPEIEHAIIKRNQSHSRQSLNTPFHTIPELSDAINPTNPDNKIENILNGTFLDTLPPDISLSLTERQWITDLQQRLDTEIETHITTQDFINFYKHRKEKTASSPSGRHYGHYKVLAQMAEEGNTKIVETLLFIINISISTSSPIERWKQSIQIMLEKGKGIYIEHLRIIQLCEADLNFTLNILWGNRMIRSALKHKALDESQYAIPGQTCNSAVWNKILYCNLLRQTLQPGIMTDYDATAAFDRVLHAMTIVTCRRFGMPQTACLFIYHLLHNMEFHVITGLGQSQLSFTNDEDPIRPGQGVLQGSSSAAPIYNMNSDVSLTSYRKLALGAAFTNPVTKITIQDHATQYVDDKTDMLNLQGIKLNRQDIPNQTHREMLFEQANKNSNIWAELQWISGGDLNYSKCFSYFIDPHYDYKTDSIKYTSKLKAPGDIIVTNPATKILAPLVREEPHTARRTLGVHLAPNGNSSTQTKICMEKAQAFLGKLKHSKLSKQTKWKAITTVMSPGVLYPLVTSTCTKKDLDRIERVIASAKCNALGLNEHFPQALLYGPLCYGGMQLPSAHASTLCDRVNYFYTISANQQVSGRNLKSPWHSYNLKQASCNHLCLHHTTNTAYLLLQRY
jgi:hypothetical protein